MRIGLSVRTRSQKDAVRGASPRRLRKKRRAAAEAKCHSDRLESAAHMVFRAIVRVIYGTGVGVPARETLD